MMKLSPKHFLLALLAVSAFATSGYSQQQQYEIHPFAGRNTPREWADSFTMKGSYLFGAKAALFADDTTQIEAEFEFLPTFDFEGTDSSTKAFAWGVGISRNVFLSKTKAIPFFNFGLGGVTVRTDSSSFTTNFPDGRSLTLDNGDTFFAFSFGVGVKAHRVIGPMGLRANITGRAMPNFFGRSNSWAEFSGGPIFTFGERR